MKIAMIGHKRVPFHEGGVEVVVEELSRRLAEKGHNVVVYNRWERGIPRVPRNYNGVTIKNIPTFKCSALNAFVYSFLAVFCALFGKYDVVHIHAEGPGAMTWLTRLFHIPSVVTIHGLDWQRSKWGRFASGYLKCAEKITARCADEIIVLSSGMEAYFKDVYGRDTCFIRNGVTAGKVREPDDILKFGLKKNEYALFVGRIVPEKGIHYLIDAFKQVQTDKKLVIAGAVDRKNKYADEIYKAALGDRRIVMTGFVSGHVLEELYSNCSVFVLPSELEGMALSLLEALTYGAKCLVSDITENTGIADKYISFFNKGDVDDLRDKLECVLACDYPEETRRPQIEFVRKTYSWEDSLYDTIKVYERAVKKHENIACE